MSGYVFGNMFFEHDNCGTCFNDTYSDVNKIVLKTYILVPII